MFDFRNFIGKNVRVVLQCSPDRIWIYEGELVGIGDVHLFIRQRDGKDAALAINSIQSLATNSGEETEERKA